MAGGAVAVEDGLAVLEVCGQSRTAAHHRGQQAEGGTQGKRAEGRGRGLRFRRRSARRAAGGDLHLRGAAWRAARQHEAAGAQEQGGTGDEGDTGHLQRLKSTREGSESDAWA